MSQHDFNTGIAAAITTITESLVRALDAKGVLDRETYRQFLLEGIEIAEKTAGPEMQQRPRIDLTIYRLLAENLADPNPEEGRRWQPTVIQGGRTDGPEPESSDS